MSISAAMAKAVQGLSMASRATDIISENVANAQTPGYVARDILVNERVVNGEGAGLQPIRVVSNTDRAAVQEVRRAQVTYQEQRIITDAMAEITLAIGDVNSEFSLSGRFDKMVNAMKNLTETPENSALQDQTINEARQFARAIRETATKMQELRENADAEIEREVDFVNETLEELKDVTGVIVSRGAAGDTAALQDQRERLIDSINERIPVNVIYDSDGSVKLSTKQGLNLLDINATELEFTSSGYLPPEVIYSFAGEEPGPPYLSTLSGLTLNGVDITPSANKVMSIDGGKLGGLFKLRDETTVTVQKQLDTIAAGLIESFRDADASLTDTTTQDSLFTTETAGVDYATLDDMLGVANEFKLNPNIDTDVGGDKRRIRDGAEATVFGPAGNSTILRAWTDALDADRTFDPATELTPTQSLAQGVREFISYTSLQNQSEKNSLEFEETKLNTVTDLRDNSQGVNIDNEMRKILYLEQIYAANAMVLRTADQMLDQLLNIR